jgi:hypothetical protein
LDLQLDFPEAGLTPSRFFPLPLLRGLGAVFPARPAAAARARADSPILSPGWNCWRTARTDRAAFLVDGCAYFAALSRALEGAGRIWKCASWSGARQ